MPRLAQELGLTVGTLHARCAQHLGLTPAKALTRWRVSQARQLLAGTMLTVAAIAERLGFANPYHFARVVRRHTGFPPSKLRVH